MNKSCLRAAHWEEHEETQDIAAVQEMHRKATTFSDNESDDDYSDEEKDVDANEDSQGAGSQADSEESSSGEECGPASSNPFALLGGE